jgi:hypothetical protein
LFKIYRLFDRHYHSQNLIAMEKRMKSPDLRLQMDFTSPLKEVKPLLSPTSLARPGGIIEELWSSREVNFFITDASENIMCSF